VKHVQRVAFFLLLALWLPLSAQAFEIFAPTLSPGGLIPEEYTCEGMDRSPPIGWKDLPEGTGSLVLVMEDLDAPQGAFVHWIIYGMLPSQPALEKGVVQIPSLEGYVRQGPNDFNRIGYNGPCPPKGDAPHHYRLRLLALDFELKSPPKVDWPGIQRAMAGGVIGEATLEVRFGR